MTVNIANEADYFGAVPPSRTPTSVRHFDGVWRRLCLTRTPEPHFAGEFPMSCYECHLEADS